MFHDFCGSPGFKNWTAQRVKGQLVRFAYTKQCAHQPAVNKMQFWCLDPAGVVVGEPWWRAPDEKTCFEQRQPVADGVVGYPSIIAQPAQIDFRTYPDGNQEHEGLNRAYLANGRQASNIALDEGADIVLKPVRRRNSGLKGAQIAA